METTRMAHGDSKPQKSFGAKRDTKRTDAEVYTRGGDGDAYAVEHGDHVVSVCDPPYYRTTGYDNGNKTTVGLAENPMGWGYEDTHAMLRAVVDGGDALKAIKRNLPEGASLGRVKVFHLAPTDRSYGDIKVSVRFANGGVGEIILVGRGMFEGKEMRGGHEVYNIRRVLAKYEGQSSEIDEVLDALDQLRDAIYAAGEAVPDEANFASIKARASSSITRLIPGPYAQAFLSSVDMEAVKSMVSGLNLAKPPSQDSNATPALSLMKNMDASLIEAVRKTISRPTRDSVAYPGGGAQGESAGRRDSVTAGRHSLMFGLATSGAKMRAKGEAITTDRMGNLVPRHSVTAGRGGGMQRHGSDRTSARSRSNSSSPSSRISPWTARARYRCPESARESLHAIVWWRSQQAKKRS